MIAPVDDADLDDEEFLMREIDFSRPMLPNRYARKPGEKTEIFIDGAVGYSLRLIPSNKILARFTSTLEAWPVIIATVEGGRSPRTLSLDWNGANGKSGKISAGPRLLRFARHCNAEEVAYPRPGPRRDARRVAES